MANRVYITDKEVACVLEVSQVTLSRMIHGFSRGGKKRGTRCNKTIDIMEAKPDSFGGFRRWKVSNLARVLNITEEELMKRIS